MGYLLGGVAATGIAGVVALALYIVRMASSNRTDLHKLVQSAKDLAEARRDNDGYKRAVEDRDHAIKSLEEKLVYERAAIETARNALDAATKKLAARGDAASVADDLNGALSRLSALSPVPKAKASEGGDS